MRIGILADPYLPVPPPHYGGIERVIDLLVRGLAASGHDVTLWAHPGSRTAARLRSYGARAYPRFRLRLADYVTAAVDLLRACGQLDLLHGFGEIEPLLPAVALRRVPAVQTYQRPVDAMKVWRASRLAGSRLRFASCSRHLYAGACGRHGQWTTVPNAVDVRRLPATATVADDAPLCFLGRLEPLKGAHHAIAIARRAGRPLVLAAPEPASPAARAYFDSQIAPHLDARTRFVGPLDDEGKARLLGAAAALLMPVEWDEPFGMVMIEAFACGTPVIGFDRGAVREVVEPGRTGFVVGDVDEAAAAVGQLAAIDRRAVRRECERRFDAPLMCAAYERLYRELVAAA